MEKDNVFIISDNPTPQELTEQLAYVTNTIALLAERVAKIKNVVADAETTYKQACDEKLLMYYEQYPKANQMKVKALVNTDDDVIRLKTILNKAKAKALEADSDYTAWDNRFIALRKIATIKTIEMQTIER